VSELALPESATPETLSVYVDTLWRLVAEEIVKTDSLERKAAALASLSGVVLAVNGAFGLNVVRGDGGWPFALYVLSFPFLLVGVGAAALALRPAKHTVFGEIDISSLRGLEALKRERRHAQLWSISGLIDRVLAERAVVLAKNAWVQRAFAFFFCGLFVVAIEASVLADRLNT
jgi:hypothetical protein